MFTYWNNYLVCGTNMAKFKKGHHVRMAFSKVKINKIKTHITNTNLSFNVAAELPPTNTSKSPGSATNCISML